MCRKGGEGEKEGNGGCRQRAQGGVRVRHLGWGDALVLRFPPQVLSTLLFAPASYFFVNAGINGHCDKTRLSVDQSAR
jgi:hypothetical protein